MGTPVTAVPTSFDGGRAFLPLWRPERAVKFEIGRRLGNVPGSGWDGIRLHRGPIKEVGTGLQNVSLTGGAVEP